MVFGIGTDLVEVERMAERLEKKSGFKELVFSADEILYCEARAFKHEHYAARFAAKEAFLKALGTGWAKGTAFNEIEICNDTEGKPGFRFHGLTAETVAGLKCERILVSLSHTKTMACATVVIER